MTVDLTRKESNSYIDDASLLLYNINNEDEPICDFEVAIQFDVNTKNGKIILKDVCHYNGDDIKVKKFVDDLKKSQSVMANTVTLNLCMRLLAHLH